MTGAPKDETPGLAGREGLGGAVVLADNSDCADTDAQRKRLSTLRAALAPRGFEVIEAGGVLVIARAGMARVVRSADDLADFARRAGVRT